MKKRVSVRIRDVADFIWPSRLYPFRYAHKGSTTHYPLALEDTLRDVNRYYAPFDSAGIPMRKIRGIGVRYIPTRVCAYGLANYNKYCNEGDEEAYEKVIDVGDWLAAYPNSMYFYEFDWRGIKAPWISAMAQGEALSVLTRCHELTGNSAYLQAAQSASEPLCRRIEEGGLRSSLPAGEPFLEEHPTNPPSHTLNGFLYAVIGICDYERYTSSDIGGMDLIDTFERCATSWDAGYWTYYDAPHRSEKKRLASAIYHTIHVELTEYIGYIAGSVSVADISRRWRQYGDVARTRMEALLVKTYREIERPVAERLSRIKITG